MLTFDENMARNRKAIEERRFGIVYVAPELVATLAMGTIRCVEHNDVPEWALLVDVHYVHEQRAFAVTVADHSFGVVPPGDHLPVLSGPTYQRVEENRQGRQ